MPVQSKVVTRLSERLLTEFLTSSPDGHGLGVCGFVTTLCTSFFGSMKVVSQQHLKESTDKKGSREGL